MTEQQFLNQKYQILCQELGDALIKQEKLDTHIKSLKLRIEHLNQAQPLMAELAALNLQAEIEPKSPQDTSKLTKV